MTNKNMKKKHIGLFVFLAVIILLCGLCIAGMYYVNSKFKIMTVTFEGTDKYSDAELSSVIFEDINFSNTILFNYDISHKEKKQIPFIETYEVTVEYPNTVHVVLYEKKIVACVFYKDNYMYFDKDGIVVESSKDKVIDVPVIDGLEFDSIVLYSLLPASPQSVFATILDLSQNIQKYEIDIDKAYFNEDTSIVLYMGNVKINLGFGDNISEKLHELKQMQDKLAGLSGVLHMEDYNGSNQFILFKKE